MKIINTKKIDQTKLISQSEFARKSGKLKQNITKLINNDRLSVVKIPGATLIYLDELAEQYLPKFEQLTKSEMENIKGGVK